MLRRWCLLCGYCSTRRRRRRPRRTLFIRAALDPCCSLTTPLIPRPSDHSRLRFRSFYAIFQCTYTRGLFKSPLRSIIWTFSSVSQNRSTLRRRMYDISFFCHANLLYEYQNICSSPTPTFTCIASYCRWCVIDGVVLTFNDFRLPQS